ncbi:MAG: putative toxin-antitoxin system toxin component, PIN family [Verrucomicrobia bacterium]|nr:putative toxin-antitoxin system toxin component, PIN family [Verrucomicrobiota bacterium]
MRIVLDTNVLVAAFTATGVCHQLYERALTTGQLFVSEAITTELRRTLKTKFRRLSAQDVAEIVAAVSADAELVEPAPLPLPVARDADDDAVLATALAGRADIIVTGDNDLLVLKTYQRIRILSPRGFLEFLDQPS